MTTRLLFPRLLVVGATLFFTSAAIAQSSEADPRQTNTTVSASGSIRLETEPSVVNPVEERRAGLLQEVRVQESDGSGWPPASCWVGGDFRGASSLRRFKLCEISLTRARRRIRFVRRQGSNALPESICVSAGEMNLENGWLSCNPRLRWTRPARPARWRGVRWLVPC